MFDKVMMVRYYVVFAAIKISKNSATFVPL